jgi:type VI secretion system secreted protein VgrG
MSLTRSAIVKSPLGDKLQLMKMIGHEELGRAFQYDLDLVSTDPDIDYSTVLGQTMTVELELPDESVREFSGHVTEFSQAGGMGRSVFYRAVLRPWVYLLSHGSNCRIFQRMTVPDVVRKIFRDAGFSDLDERLSESYRTWEYLVQYRESDFAFVTRLLEQEGIYYFFAHSGGLHTLTLCDSTSAHEAVPGYETIPYFPPQQQQRDRDHINVWNLARRIKPGVVATTDFDFRRPRVDLLSLRTEPDEDVGAGYEEFDYPGEFVEVEEGLWEARVRLEAHHTDRELAEGAGDAAGVTVGATFSLEKFPRRDQNKEHLIVRATYQINVNAGESGVGAASAFQCQFAAIDATRQFRSARSKRKPVVEGPQTAIVVGPAGEEIYTDEYGRVKVKFHWDRYTSGDEESSCWVRVSQVWAGTSFGGIHIPRIGQEVIVDFLEGDPDRPIITGRVYNFDNQPPYELPARKTQSGIKSHSTPGGTLANYNELRFEDEFGKEQVYMQAEKDLAVLVKNNEKRDVGANRSSNIVVDDKLEVGNNHTEIVGQNQTVEVGASQSVVVVATRNITSAVENITTEVRTKNVTKGETTTVGADRNETVGGSETITIGGNQVLTINAKRTQSVDKDESVSIAGARQQTVNGNDRLQVGSRLFVTAADEIVFQSGDATLTIKQNGDILLRGNNILIEGTGKINVKASSDVVVKGNKIGNN